MIFYADFTTLLIVLFYRPEGQVENNLIDSESAVILLLVACCFFLMCAVDVRMCRTRKRLVPVMASKSDEPILTLDKRLYQKTQKKKPLTPHRSTFCFSVV
jgi:hypothetical protein